MHIERKCKYHGLTPFRKTYSVFIRKNGEKNKYTSYRCICCEIDNKNKWKTIRVNQKKPIRKKDFRYYFGKAVQNKKARQQLTNWYVKKSLLNVLDVKSYKEITSEILEVARANLLLKRLIKQKLKE